jgi:hypothetical protein
MFQVFNTRTDEVAMSTNDIVAADFMVYKENDKMIGVGYEPVWEVRLVRGDRVFRITVEEL